MLLLKNATVYPQTEKAPFVGDVLCENGRIKEIGKDLSADDAETIESDRVEPAAGNRGLPFTCRPWPQRGCGNFVLLYGHGESRKSRDGCYLCR